jgi:hypothetical protein
MSIVKIARLQSRRGLMENLPQLSGGELGWAQDERRLFIGNGTLEEGAPILGNTEVLTKFSSLSDINLVYKGQSSGYTAQTGPNSGSPILRTLQEKFDERVSVKDFGAVGDDLTDDTLAIQRAINEVFTRTANSKSRKILYFPAGNYTITDTILVPPFCQIIGEKKGVTIKFQPSTQNQNPAFRTCDFNKNVGNQIGSGTQIVPEDIYISGINIVSLNSNNILLIEGTKGAHFHEVGFTGVDVPSFGEVSVVSTVTIKDVTNQETTNICFTECDFNTGDRAILIQNAVTSVVIQNSNFYNFRKAIETSGTNTGIRVVNNYLSNIVGVALDFRENTNNSISFFNYFHECSASNSLPILRFLDNDNVSVGDQFVRTPQSVHGDPISIGNTESIAIENGKKIQIGSLNHEVGRTVLLPGGQQNNTLLFSLPYEKYPAFFVEYSLRRNNFYRIGKIRVVMNPANAQPVWDDDYLESDHCNIFFSLQRTGNVLEFRYTLTGNLQDSGILKYSIKRYF